MKRIFLLMLVYSLLSSANAQSQSTKDLYRTISGLSTRLDSAYHSGNTDLYDSLIPDLDSALQHNVIAYANKEPDFMKQDFADGMDNDSTHPSIYPTTSEDNKFKVVSWQNGGGTAGSYTNLIFWQVGKKMKCNDTCSELFDSEVDTIHHIRRANGNDLYFCISEGGDHHNYGMNIKCFEIDKAGNLKINIPIFKTGTKRLSNIDIDNYDDYAYSNVSIESRANEIHFGADGKTLYVPIISDSWTKREDDEKAVYVLHYFVYEFDGTNFVYKKKQ